MRSPFFKRCRTWSDTWLHAPETPAPSKVLFQIARSTFQEAAPGGTTPGPFSMSSRASAVVSLIVAAGGLENGRPGAHGAVRNAVGIRCGAFPGNMKVSFQAARSIG